MTTYPASLLCDFYKVSHRAQYPKGTELVYSTWTPRESRIPGINDVVVFGIQAFIQKYLIDYFDEHFFNQPLAVVLNDYERVIRHALNQEPDSSHIAALHLLGFLPLKIKALPEGTLCPIRVPMLTVENTKPEFFWLTNYIETLMSCELWQPMTSATIAYAYRREFEDRARRTGGDLSFVPFQGHDFSMRGMAGLEAAAASGAGHLLSFTGTDTIPTIFYLEKYYGANITTELVGTSIPATEHSVMCAHGQDELASFKHIINSVYPTGLVSIVSDTWNLWDVLTKTLPQLKDDIMARDGKLVIRPDSGDPSLILCGDHFAEDDRAKKGVVELLWDLFGGTINEKGYKVLDPHIGVIYGDAITLGRQEGILMRLHAKGFASTNVVLGIGSYTYQYNTRDTFGFALKSTYVEIDGLPRNIFKDPATDEKKVKKSLKGKVVVMHNSTGEIIVDDGYSSDEGTDLQTVFHNGEVSNITTLAQIRKRLLNN